jgi:hypothetical protein
MLIVSFEMMFNVHKKINSTTILIKKISIKKLHNIINKLWSIFISVKLIFNSMYNNYFIIIYIFETTNSSEFKILQKLIIKG